MMPARLTHWRGTSLPVSGRVALPPVTLAGPLLILVRAFWIAMAAGALLVWVLETPFYFQAALGLQNTSGMVTLSRFEWLAGLHGLGLSPAVYAIQSLLSLLLMGGSMYIAGVLIFIRRSTSWIAVLVSFSFVTLGAGIVSAYAGPALTNAHPWLRGPLDAYLTLASPSYYALFLIPLLFPDGRFVPRYARWLAPLLILLLIAGSIAPGSPLDMHRWPVWLVGPLNVVWFGTVLASPVYRYFRVSDATQREQTKWVVSGLIAALGAFVGVGALPWILPGLTATPQRAVLFGLVHPTLTALGFTFLPISFAIAILRYRLWDIDLILNRTLVYAGLTAGVVGLYVLIVVGLGALFQAQGNIVLSLLATALVAILFQPLRERLQQGVNRLMYGERDEPYAVVSRLGQQLEHTLSPDAVLPVIVQTVAQALKLPHAAITVRQDDQFVVAAAVGIAVRDPLVLPLLCQGEAVGQLILGPRPGEAAFAPADRRLLDDLARQAGVAAQAVRLTADLQRSRERLVMAREEERRRLRRDLHDGLGPALATMAMQSEAARDLLTSDPGQTDALLSDLTEQLQAATADIRRLVHELRPPALDDLGLVGAVRNQIGRFEQGGLRITLDKPDSLPPLPAAVEVAAYRIVLEALNNVMRHAEAERCCVRLSLDETAGVLSVEIRDDGKGLPDGRRAGVGLASMQERAAELGGVCAVRVGEMGGTLVRASLPLAGHQSPPSGPMVP